MTSAPSGACSHVARVTTPSGPGALSALMPNRLLPCRASLLRPQSDSRIACATVTLAGTPVDFIELRAAAPTASMNSAPEPKFWCCACPELVAGKLGSGTGGVIGPTSLTAIQAVPGARVNPSPKNCTSTRSGSAAAPSTRRSFENCGRSVNLTALPSTPDHSGVALKLLTHTPGSPDGPTLDSSTQPMPGLRVA